MKAIVMNGASSLQPNAEAIFCNTLNFLATSNASLLLIKPAIGRAKESLKSSLTTAIPPLLSITVFTALAIISELYPMTIIL